MKGYFNHNAQIKTGHVPEEWRKDSKKAKLNQKDVDARWTKKNQQNYYGYKNHVNVDEDHKRIHTYEVTHAAMHDSQVFECLLDYTAGDDGQKRPIYADSAYCSEDKGSALGRSRNLQSNL